MFRKLLLTFALAICSTTVLAQAKNQTSLAPNGFVNDFAGVLSLRAKVDLESRLRQLAADEQIEIAVVTVKTTGNINIFDYSLSLAQNWGLGPKTRPSYSILLLAAIEDRKYHTQISRDAEEIFPTERLDFLQKQNLLPDFQKGDYSAGILKTVTAYLNDFENFKNVKQLDLDRKFRIDTPDLLLSNARQAIVVRAADWNSSEAVAQLFERVETEGQWTPVGTDFPAELGPKGLAWSEDVAYLLDKFPDQTKRERDGRSPAGVFDLTGAFGTIEKPLELKLPYTKIAGSTECVTDIYSANYNRIVDRSSIGYFDWNSSEKMFAWPERYALGVFVAQNANPAQRGKGSCIFLQIKTDQPVSNGDSTILNRADLEKVLDWLDADKKPVLIQLSTATHKVLEESWKLPKIK